LSRAKSTLNLKDLLTQKPQPLVEIPQEPVIIKKATAEEIEAAWNVFADTKKDQVAEQLLLQRPKTINGQKIILSLANAVEAQLLNNMKTELLGSLREQCQDPGITIEYELDVKETARPAYTGREKLEKLIEKYPAISEFRDRLGLDPEF
jgi:DNA polymerase-3 subunit gamma/tau